MESFRIRQLQFTMEPYQQLESRTQCRTLVHHSVLILTQLFICSFTTKPTDELQLWTLMVSPATILTCNSSIQVNTMYATQSTLEYKQPTLSDITPLPCICTLSETLDLRPASTMSAWVIACWHGTPSVLGRAALAGPIPQQFGFSVQQNKVYLLAAIFLLP